MTVYNRLVPAVRKAERAGHDAEAEPADRARHHEAMLEDAAAERGSAEPHGEGQADLMDDRRSEQSARRRRASPEAPPSRRNEPGTARTGPWPSGRAGRSESKALPYACADICHMPRSYNITWR